MAPEVTLTLTQSLAAISHHSSGLADSARDNLRSRVEHCPEWDVGDLVWHTTEVHWFWRTIAGEGLAAPPDGSTRPTRPDDDDLVAVFVAGAEALVETLRTADPEAPCWTWFPPVQAVRFVTRHQVQEAAVHHFDAAHAAGATFSIDPDIAADCVEEFLTCSLADADDVARLGTTLHGELVLAATDTGQTWTVRQETPEAALTWTDGGGPATVTGTASDLLLWLYQRVELELSDPELVARFRGLANTD